MSRYPRAVRAAAIKCIPCNAPVVETTGREYVCVECGESPITAREREIPHPGRDPEIDL